MKRIPANFERTVDIAGTAFPRPVDIDKAQTGFKQLRSLRIYRFGAGSVIEGHAEEDEVLIVVLAGSIELTLSVGDLADEMKSSTLHAATEEPDSPCVAYLPPEGAYRLLAQGDAEVAYARATPAAGPAPAVFYSTAEAGVPVLLQQFTYPRLLRIRLLDIGAGDEPEVVEPLGAETAEALVHVRTVPEEGAATMISGNDQAMALASWDTAAIAFGDRPALHLAKGSRAFVLVVYCAA